MYQALCKQFVHLDLKVHDDFVCQKESGLFNASLFNKISSFDLFESMFAVTNHC